MSIFDRALCFGGLGFAAGMAASGIWRGVVVALIVVASALLNSYTTREIKG